MPKVDLASYIVWCLTILFYAALAGAILYRRAFRRWMWMFWFSAISSIVAAALLWVYHHCSVILTRHLPANEAFLWAKVYFWSYWGERFALGACHFGIIWNVAAALLSANRRWRKPLIYTMLGLTGLALLTSAAVTLATPRPLYVDVMQLANSIDRWLSLAGCILFVITAFSLDGIGIKWRREALFVGLGLALQGAIFTAFAWYICLRALSAKEMAIPSLIRDLLEAASIALWI